jgi:hypothetical protein
MTGVAIGARRGTGLAGGVGAWRGAHRPQRLAAAAAALLLSAVLMAGSGVLAQSGGVSAQAERVGSGTGEGRAAATVVVGRGETAWEALAPHRPPGVDHTVFVHRVMRFNEVDARQLRPGDALRVPAPGGS